MGNYKSLLKGSYKLIKKADLSGGASSSLTITPTSALDFDNYSKLVLLWEAEPTSTMDISLRYNGLTGSYEWQGHKVTNTPTQTAISSASDTSHMLNQSVTTNYGVSGIVEITLGKDQINVYSTSVGTDGTMYVIHGRRTATTITELKLLASTSTLKTTTRMALYGLDRA